MQLCWDVAMQVWNEYVRSPELNEPQAQNNNDNHTPPSDQPNGQNSNSPATQRIGQPPRDSNNNTTNSSSQGTNSMPGPYSNHAVKRHRIYGNGTLEAMDSGNYSGE